MEQNADELYNRVMRTRSTLSHLHRDINTLLGLWSLLHLQYTHEGHLDGSVVDLFETRIFGFEAELSNCLGRLHVQDPPP